MSATRPLHDGMAWCPVCMDWWDAERLPDCPHARWTIRGQEKA